MHRTLIDSPHVGSYSALMVIAFIAAWWLARRMARGAGVAPRHIDNFTLICAVVSLFGARFFSWLFYFPPGYGFWTAMTMPGGGLVFYGGLIFGILTLVVYSLAMRLSLRNLLDVFAAPAALGLCLGRVGCFLAGCCWGDVCYNSAELAARNAHVGYQIQTIPALSRGGFPLSVTFPAAAGAYQQHHDMQLIEHGTLRSLPVHPVQLYEAALALVLSVFLYRTFQRRRWAGEVCAKLILGYALIRFATEFFRADNDPVYVGMTISQVISLLLAAVCLAFVRFGARKREAPANPAPALPNPTSVN